jgi:hypothetical protein
LIRPVGKPMLVLRLTDQKERPCVSIRVWPPKRSKNAWKSAIQILGIGDDAVFEVYGADPFQSLMFSMRMIRQKLSESDGQYLLRGDSIETVFPMFAPTQFGSEVLREAENAISEITARELKRMHKELGKKYPDYPFKVN